LVPPNQKIKNHLFWIVVIGHNSRSQEQTESAKTGTRPVEMPIEYNLELAIANW